MTPSARRLRQTTEADIRAIYGPVMICANCGGPVDSEHLAVTEGLDVIRLAAAMAAAGYTRADVYADRIAAEYARLSADDDES